MSKNRSGRIDIYVQDIGFVPEDIKAGGAVTIIYHNAHWLIPDDGKRY